MLSGVGESNVALGASEGWSMVDGLLVLARLKMKGRRKQIHMRKI
jgi:hypothetical protein